jgi:hypothetical protein
MKPESLQNISDARPAYAKPLLETEEHLIMVGDAHVAGHLSLGWHPILCFRKKQDPMGNAYFEEEGDSDVVSGLITRMLSPYIGFTQTATNKEIRIFKKEADT